MDLTQKLVLRMMKVSFGVKRAKGCSVSFSCERGDIPDNPSIEHHARICAHKWHWIDDENKLTTKGLKVIEEAEKM